MHACCYFYHFQLDSRERKQGGDSSWKSCSIQHWIFDLFSNTGLFCYFMLNACISLKKYFVCQLIINLYFVYFLPVLFQC